MSVEKIKNRLLQAFSVHADVDGVIAYVNTLSHDKIDGLLQLLCSTSFTNAVEDLSNANGQIGNDGVEYFRMLVAIPTTRHPAVMRVLDMIMQRTQIRPSQEEIWNIELSQAIAMYKSKQEKAKLSQIFDTLVSPFLGHSDRNDPSQGEIAALELLPAVQFQLGKGHTEKLMLLLASEWSPQGLIPMVKAMGEIIKFVNNRVVVERALRERVETMLPKAGKPDLVPLANIFIRLEMVDLLPRILEVSSADCKSNILYVLRISDRGSKGKIVEYYQSVLSEKVLGTRDVEILLALDAHDMIKRMESSKDTVRTLQLVASECSELIDPLLELCFHWDSQLAQVVIVRLFGLYPRIRNGTLSRTIKEIIGYSVKQHQYSNKIVAVMKKANLDIIDAIQGQMEKGKWCIRLFRKLALNHANVLKSSEYADLLLSCVNHCPMLPPSSGQSLVIDCVKILETKKGASLLQTFRTMVNTHDHQFQHIGILGLCTMLHTSSDLVLLSDATDLLASLIESGLELRRTSCSCMTKMLKSAKGAPPNYFLAHVRSLLWDRALTCFDLRRERPHLYIPRCFLEARQLREPLPELLECLAEIEKHTGGATEDSRWGVRVGAQLLRQIMETLHDDMTTNLKDLLGLTNIQDDLHVVHLPHRPFPLSLKATLERIQEKAANKPKMSQAVNELYETMFMTDRLPCERLESCPWREIHTTDRIRLLMLPLCDVLSDWWAAIGQMEDALLVANVRGALHVLVRDESGSCDDLAQHGNGAEAQLVLLNNSNTMDDNTALNIVREFMKPDSKASVGAVGHALTVLENSSTVSANTLIVALEFLQCKSILSKSRPTSDSLVMKQLGLTFPDEHSRLFELKARALRIVSRLASELQDETVLEHFSNDSTGSREQVPFANVLGNCLRSDIERGIPIKLVQAYTSTICELLDRKPGFELAGSNSGGELAETCLQILRNFNVSSPIALRHILAVVLHRQCGRPADVVARTTTLLQALYMRNPGVNQVKVKATPTCADVTMRAALQAISVVLQEGHARFGDDPCTDIVREVISNLRFLLAKEKLVEMGSSSRGKLLQINLSLLYACERKMSRLANQESWRSVLGLLEACNSLKTWALNEMKTQGSLSAKMPQAIFRIDRFQNKLKVAVQKLAGRTSECGEVVMQIANSLDRLSDGNVKEKACSKKDHKRSEPEWIFTKPGKVKRRKKSRLRSNNAFVDAALEQEDGSDDYEDLEDFIVCSEEISYP